MYNYSNVLGASLAVLMLALPASAQVAIAPDCDAQFAALDADSNGILTEAEAPQVYAKGRVNEAPVVETGLTKADYLAACAANAYAHPELDAGAPLEGANSFTEGQAQDRAIAWGVGGVSALVKDDLGVWRGTGTVDGAKVTVAVDYKGNVVTAPE